MIINNLNVPGAGVPPYEADSPLIINANAVLAGTVAAQRFKMVTPNIAQVLKARGSREGIQAPLGLPLDGFEFRAARAFEDSLSVP
jgi:hypothetical protein